MGDNLLKDLEMLVDKHNGEEKNLGRICWIPICEHFKTASSCQIYDYCGGPIISYGKGTTTKVLCWLKVQIEPPPYLNVRILEMSIP